MKSTRTTWAPDRIGVGDSDFAGGLTVLELQDGSDVTVIPLAREDAHRIGAALLGVEIPDAFGGDEHNESCSSLRGEAFECDCLLGHGGRS